MAANTGRTIRKWVKLFLDDKDGTLREIPIASVNGVGLDAPEVDISAWQDEISNVLIDKPSCKITITGPFDSSALVAASVSGAAPSLSGSHTVLKDIVGKNTPLAFGIAIGMRQYYTTDEPCFGLDYSADTSGFLCRTYTVDLDNAKYSAEFVVFGTVAPSWIDDIPTS
jgi:hypothetical protein